MSTEPPRVPGVPEDLVARHEALLARVPAPRTPEAMLRPEFLEQVHEAAAAALEAGLEDSVVEELSRRIQAPVAGRLAERSLGNLPTASAPGLLWPRLREDLRSVARRRGRALALRRLAATVASAAAVLLAVFLWFHEGTAGTSRDEIVIMRHEVEQPILPGYSVATIVRRIHGGQNGPRDGGARAR